MRPGLDSGMVLGCDVSFYPLLRMVYRPPKKSPAGPRFPGPQASVDPLSGPLSRAADGEEIMRGDDRNLVVVDEKYAGGDFEDRLWLFWRHQKNNLLILAGLACAGLIGWQGWKLYQQNVAEKLQSEYQAAEGGPGLQAFAQAHPGTTLGKLAQLEAADAFFKDGKFADAAKAYTDATTIWGTETYGQRARIGLAMSLLQNNDISGAHQQFEALATDTQAVAYYRSEAAFDLAILEAQAGNQKDVGQWIDKIKSLKDDTWINEANTFIDMVSSLPGSKMLPAGSSAAPAKPLVLTNSVTSAKPATAKGPITQPPSSAPATPPASTPAPAAPSNSGFDLTPLLKASGSAGSSN